MKALSVQTKLLLLLTLLLVIALICLTFGASLLNYAQTRTQNEARLKTALGSFQREFERGIARDQSLFHESFTHALKTTLAFKAMVLIDNADIQIPTRMIELGTLLNAARLAFYYRIEGERTLQLRLYYDRDLGGSIQIYVEDQTPKHRLIRKNEDGRITVSDIAPPPQLFPMTFPAFDQSSFLEVRNGVLLLVADLPYRSAFSELNYSLQQGEELGRFVLEKPLDLNLPELDNDLGVHFAVYDHEGIMGQGRVRMPDIDLAHGQQAFFNEHVIKLSDTAGNTYDSMLKPLTDQHVIVGYVAANISQEKTFQKIGETVRVLVLIACGVLLVAFLLMSVVVTRMIAQPLKHITAVTHRQLQGDLAARIELEATDEYGELGQTFNRLSHQVNTLLREQHLTIANLKQTEEALRESEARFRRLTENAKDMIYRMSLPDGQYTYVSPAAETIVGYPPQEFYHSPKLIASIMHPDWSGYFEEAWQNLLQGELLPYYEYQILHKSGGIRWLNERNVLVREGNGNPVAIEGIVTDITARKQAEEQIQTLNAELETRVHQRTAQLEAVNEELKSFAYIVSHDLKAPLRGINQITHWLREDYALALDASGKEMLDLLGGRVKRMDAMIEGILQYSRVGRIEGKDERVDLMRLVREVLELLALPPQIQVVIAQEFPTVRGNPTQFSQIFQNLIGNAVKFMEQPAGEIRLDCVDGGDYWQFSVADNGPGIAPEHHAKIFQIFQTLTPRDKQENTGIGLAIVKKIVEFYGGRIWVESEPGAGSTFWFTLPKRSPP